VELRVTVDVEVRCIVCGAERDIPDGNAARVLTDVTTGNVVAETPDRCVCGSNRICVSAPVAP
jgi:hypothetical protein